MQDKTSGVPASPSGSTPSAAIPNAAQRCHNCSQFASDELYKNFGSCPMLGDSNDLSFSPDEDRLGDASVDDKAFGWDYESYKAGVYVGRNFGCIHWSAA